MTTIAERLAAYTASFRFEDLPAEVVHQAKRVWLDSLGCAIGGLESEPALIARDLAGTSSAPVMATLLGTGTSSPADLAAFANGVALRSMDYNDTYTGRELGHPSDHLAAILAAGEIASGTGRDAIAATVLAYEVFCRLCDAVQVHGRGFDYITLGGVSAAVAVAKMLRLPEAQIAETINLALTPGLALFQTRVGSVSLWKACAAANVGRNAIFAAWLAQRGLTGPSPVFEGRHGLFAVLGETFALGSLGGAGASFKIMETSFKRFPVGHVAQTMVEAALQLRETIGDPAAIADVELRTFQTAIDIMAGDAEKWRPPTRESADHSMPYAVGVALLLGTPAWEHFGEKYLASAPLLELVQKMRVTLSAEAEEAWPEAMLAVIEVTTRSGEHRSARVPFHRGHWRNPMTDSELETKLRGLARGHLSPRRCAALLERVWSLDRAEDLGEVARLTGRDAEG